MDQVIRSSNVLTYARLSESKETQPHRLATCPTYAFAWSRWLGAYLWGPLSWMATKERKEKVTSGSKKQRSKIVPQKRSIDDSQNRKRNVKTEEIKVRERSSEPKNDTSSGITRPEISEEKQEQIMAEKLGENAELIEAIMIKKFG